MSDTPPVPAGWYPDSEVPGGLRWWDGTTWTEHRQAAQPAAPALPTAPASVPIAAPAYAPVSPAYAPAGASGSAGEPPLWAPWYGISFGQAFARVWKKYATFSGRASLSEYWWWVLANALVGVALYVIFLVLLFSSGVYSEGSDGSSVPGPQVAIGFILLVAWALAIVIPNIAITVRRLHDANYSGGMYFLGFIPFVGGIILLIFTLMPSNPVGARFDRPF